MTTTLVYSVAADGYLTSTDANYTTARNGPADSVTNAAAGYYGQNNNGGNYSQFQTFLGFDYAAIPATDMVTSVVIQVHHATQLSPGVVRNLELRGSSWRTSGVQTSDWRNANGLASIPLYGQVMGAQGAASKMAQAGSDLLLAAVPTVTAIDLVLVSNRQRAGNVPTSDEGSAVWTSDQTGTAYDPCLVISSVTRTRHTPVLGAVVQLSTGYAHLTSDGAASPTVTLQYVTAAGVASTIGAISIGTGAVQFAGAGGAQALTLAADASDNLYVVGRSGAAQNSVLTQAWSKGVGWTWTAGTVRAAALPAYDAAINNVSAAVHAVAGGTLMVAVGHTAGAGTSGGTGNELAYALLDLTYLRTGVGTLVRGAGTLLGTVLPAVTPGSVFNTYANDTGTGLDVVADRGQADRGFLLSFGKGILAGENVELVVGRYTLNASGNGFTHTSSEDSVAWGAKDASSKVRVLSVGTGQVAVVTADKDSGYGLTVNIFQAAGSGSGMTMLGGVELDAQGITSMPDGPAVAGVPWWDAVYNATENAVWVYYRHASDATKLMRTSVSLDTYNATGVAVEVHDTGANTITSVRVPRNAYVTEKGYVHVGWLNGAVLGDTLLADTFNLAPNAPTLTPKANFDATAAATFAWTFNDPNAGDTPSAYELEIEDVSDGSVDFDSGKVASTGSTRNLTAGTLVNGKSYRWRVRTWDALDVVGPWSPYGTFSTSAGGTVTITSPAVDNAPGQITDDVLVSWSVSGTTQASYLVHLYRDGVLVSDSGWVAGTATSRLVSGMTTDVEHEVRVQVRNASLVQSGIGTRKITPSYGVPEVPEVTLSPVPSEGYVLVSVNNPVPQGDRPEVVRNRILRRRAGTTDPYVEVGTCSPDGSLRDYGAPARAPLEYVARGETA